MATRHRLRVAIEFTGGCRFLRHRISSPDGAMMLSTPPDSSPEPASGSGLVGHGNMSNPVEEELPAQVAETYDQEERTEPSARARAPARAQTAGRAPDCRAALTPDA
jgi:hypothetical protein